MKKQKKKKFRGLIVFFAKFQQSDKSTLLLQFLAKGSDLQLQDSGYGIPSEPSVKSTSSYVENEIRPWIKHIWKASGGEWDINCLIMIASAAQLRLNFQKILNPLLALIHGITFGGGGLRPEGSKGVCQNFGSNGGLG